MRRLINGETSVCRPCPKIRGMTATHLSIMGQSYMQSMRAATYFTLSRCPRGSNWAIANGYK